MLELPADGTYFGYRVLPVHMWNKGKRKTNGLASIRAQLRCAELIRTKKSASYYIPYHGTYLHEVGR
jgi:hypothetical protein